MNENHAWLREGADVAVFSRGNTREHGRAILTTVTKIGKRDVVLANGERFNVNSLVRRTGTWSPSVYLLAADAPEVVAALRAEAIENVYRSASAALQRWKDTLDDQHAEHALKAITAALSDSHRTETG